MILDVALFGQPAYGCSILCLCSSYQCLQFATDQQTDLKKLERVTTLFFQLMATGELAEGMHLNCCATSVLAGTFASIICLLVASRRGTNAGGGASSSRAGSEEDAPQRVTAALEFVQKRKGHVASRAKHSVLHKARGLRRWMDGAHNVPCQPCSMADREPVKPGLHMRQMYHRPSRPST